MKSIEDIKKEILELGSDNLGRFGGKFEGGIHLQKDALEYAQLVDYLSSLPKPPRSYLEVGAAAGGGCYVLYKYLQFDRILIMEDDAHQKAHMREKILEDVPREEYIGDAHSVDALLYVGGVPKFDLMLFDADPSFQGTLSWFDDYTQFLSDDGIIVLHNISESSCKQVIRVDSILDHKRIKRFVTREGHLGLGLYKK